VHRNRRKAKVTSSGGEKAGNRWGGRKIFKEKREMKGIGNGVTLGFKLRRKSQKGGRNLLGGGSV